MAKPATTWHDAATRSEVGYYDGTQYLATEAADLFVTGSGDFLVLGDVTRTIPSLTEWDVEGRQLSNWHDYDGRGEVNTSNLGVQRTQQNAVVRVLQNGTTRTLEATVILRPNTTWSEVDE